MVRDRPGRTTQLRARRCSRFTAVLLPGRGAGNLLTPPNGPSSPRIPGREQSGRPSSAPMGRRTRGHHLGRAARLPAVRRTLLCDVLARSSWLQTRGGLPQSRSGLTAPAVLRARVAAMSSTYRYVVADVFSDTPLE